MGAVAITRALYTSKIKPAGIILECPFGSMYQTVTARFKIMHTPSFPMAGLLVFWGGVQHGFWAFGHNPTKYAKKIKCPTLLLYGEKDNKVSSEEIKEIFAHVNGPKTLKTYKNTGHESYLEKNRQQWTKDVEEFLKPTLSASINHFVR